MKTSFPRFVLCVLLIGVAVALAYSNSYGVPFIFDDYQNIEGNPNVWIEEFSVQSIWTAVSDNPTPRPVAYLSFGLNYYFGKTNVFGYHLINNLIHAINGLLVFLLMHIVLSRISLAQETSETTSHFWIALSGALIFVLHPVQTQSVTYIVQRMTSMCSMFYLAGLLAYLQGRSVPSTTSIFRKLVWWSLALSFWLLAIGTKQFAVTFPVAILLFEWILFYDGDRKWFRQHAGQLVLVLVLIAITAFAFKGTDLFKLFTRGYTKRDFSLIERLLTEGRVMMHYLSLVIFPLPSRLTLLYDFQISKSLFVPGATFVSWCLIGSAVIGSICFAQRSRLLCLTILWFFLHLAVESTVIPLELVYEHRLYLPMFGASMLIAIGIFDFFQNQKISIVCVAMLCILLGTGTHIRNKTWGSKLSIWNDNVHKSADPRGFFNLATAHAENGRYQQAMRNFRQAVKIEPRLQSGYVTQGRIYEFDRDYGSALREYGRAIAIPRADAKGIISFDEAYAGRARVLSQQGKFEQALIAINKAIEANPNRTESFATKEAIVENLNNTSNAIKN